MKKFIYLFTIIFCFWATTIFADDSTYVAGVINGETWTKENSPYCVVDDITVESLTVEPGVEVLFMGNYAFTVVSYGWLEAIGTEQDNILFTCPGYVNAWKGLLLDNCQSTKLVFCIIENVKGHGLIINSSNPVIRNCIIRNNFTSSSIPILKNTFGAGVLVLGEATLTDCIIENNRSESLSYFGLSISNGGGIYCNGILTLEGCIIRNNIISAESSLSAGLAQGGGVYVSGKLEMNNCVVQGNYVSIPTAIGAATCSGGGIAVAGDIHISNCLVSNNGASSQIAIGTSLNMGGGLYVTGELQMQNSIVSDNDAIVEKTLNIGISRGGGIYVGNNSRVVNSIICRNLAITILGLGEGGGLYLQNGVVEVENCCLSENIPEGTFNSGSVDLNIMNSILWANSKRQITNGATVSYSCIQGGYPGAGNINANPLLDSDCHIFAESPCVDAGNPNSLYNDLCFPPSWDTELNDMGAHGGPGACSWNPDPQVSLVIQKCPEWAVPGSKISIKILVENQGVSSCADKLRMEVTGPVSTTFKVWSGYITLETGFSKTYWLSLTVPSNTPPETYFCTLFLSCDGEDLASDSFDIDIVTD